MSASRPNLWEAPEYLGDELADAERGVAHLIVSAAALGRATNVLLLHRLEMRYHVFEILLGAEIIDWREGAAESMPFQDASFDTVLSQFGLMFMDREQAIREMLRVLKPAGRLAVAVWDSLENIPAFRAEIEVLERLAGLQAANAVRAPFALGNREHLAQVFNGAGAGSVSIATLQGVARFPSVRVMVEADLRGWLPVMGVNLSEDLIGDVLAEAERVLEPYAAHGRVAFDVQAHVVTTIKL